MSSARPALAPGCEFISARVLGSTYSAKPESKVLAALRKKLTIMDPSPNRINNLRLALPLLSYPSSEETIDIQNSMFNESRRDCPCHAVSDHLRAMACHLDSNPGTTELLIAAMMIASLQGGSRGGSK